MKLNKICYLAVGLVLAMTSCKEGQYWDAASNPDTVYAFPKAAATISLLPADEVPSSYTVMITRNVAGPAVTVPVTFTSNSDLLSGADEVVFEAGKLSALYTINIENNIEIGDKHTVTLTFEEQEPDANKTEEVLPANNQKFTFTIGKDYTWQTVGNALCISSFAGNEEPAKTTFQQAKEYNTDGNKLLRLMSPYYAMDPDYSEEGANIQFIVGPDNEAVEYAPAWQYTGESDSNGYYFLGAPAEYGCSFTNEGDVYTIDGIEAVASSPNGGSLTLKYYDTFIFQLVWK